MITQWLLPYSMKIAFYGSCLWKKPIMETAIGPSILKPIFFQIKVKFLCSYKAPWQLPQKLPNQGIIAPNQNSLSHVGVCIFVKNWEASGLSLEYFSMFPGSRPASFPGYHSCVHCVITIHCLF